MLNRLAWREIRNNRSFSLFFVFNLILGLYGLVVLDGVKTAVESTLSARSRTILGADLSMRSRRAFTPEEDQTARTVVGPRAREQTVLAMYTMAASARQSRLAEVTAVDPAYPFYGHLQLDPSGSVSGSTDKNLFHDRVIWVDADLARQLDVRPGDSVRIGGFPFRVSDVVTEDDGNGWRAFDLAARLYISRSALEATGLLASGSVVWYSRLYQLPDGEDADGVARRLDHQIEDPGIEVESARQSGESAGRLQGFLDDYLGLTALVSLFLSGLGAGYLFRSFLARRLKDIAILMSLGLSAGRAQRLYALQLFWLGLMSAAGAAVLAYATLPLMIQALAWFLAFPIIPVFHPWHGLLTLACGASASLVLCLPFLSQLRTLTPNAIFQEQYFVDENTIVRRSLLWFLPALAIYAGLAVWQAHSWKVGLFFIGAFVASGATLAFLGWIILGLGRRVAGRASLIPRLALRQLTRDRGSSLSIFVTLSLGALLISLIPQIEKSLETQIVPPSSSQVPGLFLFDIQDDQVEPLTQYLSSQHLTLEHLTPLIRGRLLSVNGHDFEKSHAGSLQTREEQRDERFRNRGFNLTYRDHLLASESIVRGRPFLGAYQGDPSTGPPAEISVEQDFAKRLHFALGDVLTFDIQGVPQSGRIVNFRKVSWTSFQPNFFIQFQSGVLESAPKTYLGSLRGLSIDDKVRVQNGVTLHFPNVSMIDISAVIQKMLLIMTQMGWALRTMALLSLVAGLVVLFSIANHQATARRLESNLLKVLGADFALIRRLYDVEFGGLALIAGSAGAGAGILVSYLLSRWVFDRVWAFSWQAPLAVMCGVPIVSLLTARLATARTLRQKSQALLD